jgi:predicted Holliday junction resolvase-like endonuclease
MELLLTNLEIRALKETLEAEIADLQMEIAAARDQRVREEMITTKELLLSILEKLPAPVLEVA